jgi:hypothetical protein
MRVCRSRQDLTFQYPCSPLISGERVRSGGILPAKTHPLVRRVSVAGVPLSGLGVGAMFKSLRKDTY